MSFFDSMSISASGLAAQRIRMDVISENIANIETTKAANGEPYRRKMVLFEQKSDNNFSNILKKKYNNNYGNGIKATKIVEDKSQFQSVYDPNHPDADEKGYVYKSNVNIVKEMVDMISASRSYEANVTSINISKAMINKTLEISR